jgi:hypothetical protein
VAEKAEAVAGHPATCFDLTVSGAQTEICLDADGIPVRVGSASSTMTLTVLDHALPAGIFTPPTAAS